MPADPFAALREALKLSPDNLPLRRHLADSLLQAGRMSEAETEYKELLAREPHNTESRLGLARCFLEQQKTSAALVIVEDMLKGNSCPPQARVLYARLMFRQGDIPNAVAQYKLAIEEDASLREEDLDEKLGIGPGFEESEVVEGRLREMAEPTGGGGNVPIERPQVKFQDVGGMDALKEEIRLKIIHPLNHPDLYRAYGKPIGGGILMYGPPGCGKTHLARATAGEISAGFLSVGINDVLEMWIGSSERNLHEVFANARDNKPCVLFFDEVDALGARRSDLKHSAGRQLTNQFLSEMDGIDATNEGVLILAATNSPWHIDPAFRRPGRFDRILFVPPPDLAARAAILEILLRGKPCDRIDFLSIAKKCEQFSGADLKAVVDLAIEAKLQEALKAGMPKPLTTADLLAAAPKQRSTTKEWFSTARNHALYANQGGLYDDVLKYMKLQ
ncbi:ATP-dependent zinc metalloprotease FtsH [Anatilimnocola aggregata]|uniref:ATP-dependent zinc metalloprotease FtsH n=1 Tax=Anatilimnocola aggregata TaxID=2528021 RepID=A0A517Y6Q9_9BACT|nr:ATP-binding protein [Anatilimnocola aggregata]QDU25923.1 ATP-dependent zinc metalloprotease FtsH [Anatilimnocola aggregata]